MQQRITKQFLETVQKNSNKDQFFYDPKLTGFGVKVTRSGRKNFIVNARLKGGDPKRVTIGTYPQWQISDAKDEALSLLKKLQEGIDPLQQRREALSRAKQQAAHESALMIPFKNIVEDYLHTRQLKPKTEYDYRNTIKNCFEDWNDIPIRSITRKNVEDRFYHIKKTNKRSQSESGQAQAQKAMRILKAIMSYAQAEEINGERLITYNPVQVIQDKKISKTLKPRSRSVPLDDIWKVIRTFEWLPNQTAGDLLTLLLYTGLRLNEASSLKWKDVNFDHDYFTVTDTKNGLDHFVPMSRDVRNILSNRQSQSNAHPIWVFPNRQLTGHIKDVRKNVAKVNQVSDITFTPHDLRRTFASIAACCGLDHMTIKRAMNHKHKDITEQYIQRNIEDLRKPMSEIQNFIDNSILHEEKDDWIEEHLGKEFLSTIYN